MSPVLPLVPLWRPRGPVNLGGGCAASYFGGEGIAEEW
jgi:hypothetical protein